MQSQGTKYSTAICIVMTSLVTIPRVNTSVEDIVHEWKGNICIIDCDWLIVTPSLSTMYSFINFVYH